MGFRPRGKAQRFATIDRVYDEVPIWPNDVGDHPSVERILSAIRGRADMQMTWGPTPHAFYTETSAAPFETQTVPCTVEGYELVRTVLHAPKGDLVKEEYVSPLGYPPHTERRFIQNENDLEIFLSIPYRRVPVDIASYREYCRQQPDDVFTVVMPGYSPATVLLGLTDLEQFSIWTLERRSKLMEVCERLHSQRMVLIRDMLAAGIGPVYQTIGQEEFIPPLMGPRDLEEFVLRFDREFCRTVHDAGGLVYCHCHGRVNTFLEQFADAGIDALHPLEPPPMGDTNFADAKRRVGGRMTLAGNIETHDLMTLDAAGVRELVRSTIRTGKPGGRFCLVPSAELVVGPTITDKLQANILAFMETALEHGRY